MVNRSMLAVALLIGTILIGPDLRGPDLRLPDKASGRDIAQAWGVQCQTPLGNCPVPPQPISSPCWCGQTPGYVVP